MLWHRPAKEHHRLAMVMRWFAEARKSTERIARIGSGKAQNRYDLYATAEQCDDRQRHSGAKTGNGEA